MSPRPSQPPPSWAQDTLSSYFEELRGNHFATFVGKPAQVADLAALECSRYC
jgi:hypothetical protein